MTSDKPELEARCEERDTAPRAGGLGEVLEAGWVARELVEERAGAMRRTGRRLGRMLKELKSMETELGRLDLTLQLPGLSARLRSEIQAEIDLSVDAYNHLREAACNAYRQLISQRESFGFRGHEMVRRCYPIPDLLLLPDAVEETIEA